MATFDQANHRAGDDPRVLKSGTAADLADIPAGDDGHTTTVRAAGLLTASRHGLLRVAPEVNYTPDPSSGRVYTRACPEREVGGTWRDTASAVAAGAAAVGVSASIGKT